MQATRNIGTVKTRYVYEMLEHSRANRVHLVPGAESGLWRSHKFAVVALTPLHTEKEYCAHVATSAYRVFGAAQRLA
jgi:hypothetical protein